MFLATFCRSPTTVISFWSYLTNKLWYDSFWLWPILNLPMSFSPSLSEKEKKKKKVLCSIFKIVSNCFKNTTWLNKAPTSPKPQRNHLSTLSPSFRIELLSGQKLPSNPNQVAAAVQPRGDLLPHVTREKRRFLKLGPLITAEVKVPCVDQWQFTTLIS